MPPALLLDERLVSQPSASMALVPDVNAQEVLAELLWTGLRAGLLPGAMQRLEE